MGVHAASAMRYSLGVLQARPQAKISRLKGEVGFMNPDGSQLPLQERSTAVVVLFMAWAFLGSAALLFILAELRRRRRSRLHGLLLLALMTKCLVLFLIRQDIKAVSQTGR